MTEASSMQTQTGQTGSVPWVGVGVRGQLRFAVVTILVAAVAGWIMTLFVSGPRDGAAILTSGILAVSIQVAAFPTLRRLAAKNVVAAMGGGAAIRFGSLILYALLAPKVLLLPAAPALLSLAVFYFLSMVIEPLFFRS